MNATRFVLAAMVLGTAIGANQANAQCSGNAGSCNLTNTVSATVNALVKLGMSTAATTLSSPTADQVEVGANLADAGPTFTIKANRSWTLNIKTTNASNWTYVGSNGGTKPISDITSREERTGGGESCPRFFSPHAGFVRSGSRVHGYQQSPRILSRR